MAKTTGKDTTVKRRSQMASMVHRYKKNKLAVFGLIIFLFMIFMALTADFFFDYDLQALEVNVKERYLTPGSPGHIFGTDQYGRDLLARIVFGTRISLIVAFGVAGIALLTGTIIGSIAGYFGGRVDNILMRLMDVLMAVPEILLAICIVAALGPGIGNLILANGISGIPRFARLVRSNIMTIKSSEYIEAAKVNGTSTLHIITRHMLPNSIGVLIVQTTLSMASAILHVAALSFVGLGITPPTPEWGSMLSTGKEFLRQYPHMVNVPGLAIMFAVMSFNLMGDGLRDALDPRLKN